MQRSLALRLLRGVSVVLGANENTFKLFKLTCAFRRDFHWRRISPRGKVDMDALAS